MDRSKSVARRVRKARVRSRTLRWKSPAMEWRSVFLEVPIDASTASHEEAHAVPQTVESLNDESKLHTRTPPRLGERILLLILSKDQRINLPGDLAEEYGELAGRHGEGYAKLWYYKQVVASAWPLIYNAARWGVLAWVGRLVRRYIS
jgi:hypothetical protein